VPLKHGGVGLIHGRKDIL